MDNKTLVHIVSDEEINITGKAIFRDGKPVETSCNLWIDKNGDLYTYIGGKSNLNDIKYTIEIGNAE